MSAGPVIIDDGGSTRIRYLAEDGDDAMDSLLDVGPLAVGSEVQGSRHTLETTFKNLTIVSINPNSGEPTSDQYSLAPGDRIVIVSGEFTVQVDIAEKSTVITSIGSERSGKPWVTAKEQNQKRRYVIDEAPLIDSVTVTLKAGGSKTLFDVKEKLSSYTQVHFGGYAGAAAN